MRAFFEYNDGYIHETGCSLKIIVKEGTPETDRIPALPGIAILRLTSGGCLTAAFFVHVPINPFARSCCGAPFLDLEFNFHSFR